MLHFDVGMFPLFLLTYAVIYIYQSSLWCLFTTRPALRRHPLVSNLLLTATFKDRCQHSSLICWQRLEAAPLLKNKEENSEKGPLPQLYENKDAEWGSLRLQTPCSKFRGLLVMQEELISTKHHNSTELLHLCCC